MKKNLVWGHDLKQFITSPEFKEQIERATDVTNAQFFCSDVYDALLSVASYMMKVANFRSYPQHKSPQFKTQAGKKIWKLN